MDFTLVHLANNQGYSQLNTGTVLNNSTTLTDISAGGAALGQAFTFPADYLQVGQQFRVRCGGVVSNTGTPTLLVGLYYGGASGVALASSGAVTTSSGLSNSVWRFEADFRVTGVGSSGAILTIPASITGITASPVTFGSITPVTVDTGSVKVLTVAAQWGTANASNTIQSGLLSVERLNEGGS